MDSNSKKPNKAGELQPYIPKGNGDKSGEYTFSYFCVREGCTKEDLKKILTEEEIRAVRSYTDFRVGCALNKRLRDGSFTMEDAKTENLIHLAITKHKMKNNLIVYRGIAIDKETFFREFYEKYKTKEVVNRSIICSTSRNIKRAIKGATNTKSTKNINVVFEILLLKGVRHCRLRIFLLPAMKKKCFCRDLNIQFP